MCLTLRSDPGLLIKSISGPPPWGGGVSSQIYGLKGFFGKNYGLKEIELIWSKIGT